LSFGGSVPLKPRGYRVEVGIPEATQLAVQADVRASGVSIGTVVAKRRDEQSNRTLATIELDRRFAPLHSDARATLRQKTLLGETFVEMTLGSPDAPYVEEGGRLRNERVQPSVEIDEVLNTFDPFTRQAFRLWQQQLGRAVDGRGQDLNDSFGTLPQFVESGGDLMAILDENRESLAQLVRDTGVVFGALTQREGQLRRLVTAQDDVFSAIASEREAFADTWRTFPTFLDESRATFDRLRTFSAKAEPVVRDLGPAFRDLKPALDSLGDPGPNAVGHYLRQFGPLGTEAFAIQPERLSTNRGNAYLNPLGVLTSPEAQKFKILPAFDCNNTGGEHEPGGTPTAPGCRVQKPFAYDGAATRYPRLRSRAYR
jgi:virulence factor Mce-like protein